MEYLNCANSLNADQTETMIIANDRSPSMEFEDWKPNRLQGANKACIELLKVKAKKFPQDEVGVIGFGRQAKLLHAPVCAGIGFRSLKKAVQNPWTLSGTNFTAALVMAMTYLLGEIPEVRENPLSKLFGRPTPSKSMTKTGCKRLIMLTDGDHNDDSNPLPIASHLKLKGVIIDCIGIAGGPQDVDEELLKEIASKNPDGSARYCFIGDQAQLIQKYQTLARHICPA